MGLRDRLKALREDGRQRRPAGLPDPSVPPANRGEWGEAALTNVDITEFVKTQLRTQTRPQQK